MVAISIDRDARHSRHIDCTGSNDRRIVLLTIIVLGDNCYFGFAIYIFVVGDTFETCTGYATC